MVHDSLPIFLLTHFRFFFKYVAVPLPQTSMNSYIAKLLAVYGETLIVAGVWRFEWQFQEFKGPSGSSEEESPTTSRSVIHEFWYTRLVCIYIFLENQPKPFFKSIITSLLLVLLVLCKVDSYAPKLLFYLTDASEQTSDDIWDRSGHVRAIYGCHY